MISDQSNVKPQQNPYNSVQFVLQNQFHSTVESQKLTEAATEAEKVEIQRKVLEAKNMVNEQRIDSLNSQIIIAQEVALVSSKNAEEATRKLAMTQVKG